jgi:hypothetical protein
LSYNIGTSSEINQFNCTFNVGYSHGPSTSFFLEYFSSFEKQLKPQHNIDGGVLYLLNHNFQIDLAFGSSIDFVKDDYFITTGLSYKL